MAGDIRLTIDLEGFNEIVRLGCENVQCRFNLISQHACALKWINVSKSGKCANFERIEEGKSAEFIKRLSE